MPCCAVVVQQRDEKITRGTEHCGKKKLRSPGRTYTFLILILQILGGLSILLGQFNNLRESRILREIKFIFFFQRPVTKAISKIRPSRAADEVGIRASTLTWARIARRGNDVQRTSGRPPSAP